MDIIILMGGYDINGYKNDTWRSTDYGATWSLVNSSPGWTARYGHISVVMADGSIIMIGGYGGDYPYFKNDVWKSADDGSTWTLVTAGGIERVQHTGVVIPDDSIVLMGGVNSVAYRNDVWRSTDYGATWKYVNLNTDSDPPDTVLRQCRNARRQYRNNGGLPQPNLF